MSRATYELDSEMDSEVGIDHKRQPKYREKSDNVERERAKLEFVRWGVGCPSPGKIAQSLQRIELIGGLLCSGWCGGFSGGGVLGVGFVK